MHNREQHMSSSITYLIRCQCFKRVSYYYCGKIQTCYTPSWLWYMASSIKETVLVQNEEWKDVEWKVTYVTERRTVRPPGDDIAFVPLALTSRRFWPRYSIQCEFGIVPYMYYLGWSFFFQLFNHNLYKNYLSAWLPIDKFLASIFSAKICISSFTNTAETLFT